MLPFQKYKMSREENRRELTESRAPSNQKKNNKLALRIATPDQSNATVEREQQVRAYSNKQSGKSFKRIGSKATIPAYHNFVSDSPGQVKVFQRKPSLSRGSGKENYGFSLEPKKKLKRIGKKNWVAAFKQTITDYQCGPNLDFSEFKEKAQEQEKKQQSQYQDLLDEPQRSDFVGDQSDNQSRLVSPFKKASSEMEQLSVNLSLLQAGENGSGSDISGTLESDIEKLNEELENYENYFEKIEEKDSHRKAQQTKLEYESYSINVNYHQNQGFKRESQNTSALKLQELLKRISEQKPEIEQTKSESSQEHPPPKSSVLEKVNGNYLDQKTSFYSNKTAHHQDGNKKLGKDLPVPFPFPQQTMNQKANSPLTKKNNKVCLKSAKKPIKVQKQDSLASAFDLGEQSLEISIPTLHKVGNKTDKQLDAREGLKSQSLHGYTSSQKKSYMKKENEKQKPKMASSLKRNYRQMEMSKYIQQARKQLKGSVHF